MAKYVYYLFAISVCTSGPNMVGIRTGSKAEIEKSPDGEATSWKRIVLLTWGVIGSFQGYDVERIKRRFSKSASE